MYIGLDIGGTNIRVGAVNNNEITYSYKEKTLDNVSNVDELYNKIIRLIENVPNYKNANAIGISVAGSVDNKTSNIVTSKNLSMLINYPLKTKLEKHFNINVFIENDAKVIGLAESILGKGKDYNIVCYITISTGCGGAFIVNKKIYTGSNNFGGYIPRIILDGKNTSDNLLSGRAMYENAKEVLNINEVKDIFDLYRNNNEIAKKIVDDFKNNLLVLLLNVSATLNPDIIILGGSMLNDSDVYLDEVKKMYYDNIHPLAKNTIIDVSTLKDAGILGACLLANNK